MYYRKIKYQNHNNTRMKSAKFKYQIVYNKYHTVYVVVKNIFNIGSF